MDVLVLVRVVFVIAAVVVRRKAKCLKSLFLCFCSHDENGLKLLIVKRAVGGCICKRKKSLEIVLAQIRNDAAHHRLRLRFVEETTTIIVKFLEDTL